MGIFTSTPGYAGYFGPTSGEGAIIAFGRGSSGTIDVSKMNQGFLCDRYDIRWNRPAQAKRFLNVDKPVAIVGYGTGTLTLTGLFGTYKGFKAITEDNSGSTKDDVCNPLYCIIRASNNYAACEGDKSAGDSPIDWECMNLVLSDIQVTGQAQDNGVLFQQANVVFTMGGFAPSEQGKMGSSGVTISGL